MRIFLIFLFLVCGNAFAQMPTYTLQTGYAYSTCNGNIVGKYNQKAGDKVTLTAGCTITDVANATALQAISIYQPPQGFNTNQFVEQLAATNLITEPNVLPYYAVIKDLASYNNWQQLANLIAGLLKNGILSQTDVDTLDTTLENQSINLDSYNSQVNVAY